MPHSLGDHDHPQRWGLAGFDLDGTLVPGTTVLLHLAGKLGHLSRAEELIRGYETYELNNVQVAVEAAPMLVGLTERQVWQFMDDIPQVAGIQEAVRSLHRRNIHCTISTTTFSCAARWFARKYSFDSVWGLELVQDGSGRFTGAVASHADEYGKAARIEELTQALGVPLHETFFVGDSRSDIPTFALVGFSVALNGSARAISAASTHVESTSLYAALDLVPDLFHG